MADPRPYRSFSSGTTIGIVNLVVLLMCLFQVASSGKNGNGFEAVLFMIAISFILTIVGSVYTLKDLHKDRKGTTIGLLIHGVLIFIFVTLLGMFFSF